LFLYFIIKSILTSRYSNNKVKEIISRLNYDDIKNYSKKYSDDLILPKNYSNINKYPHLFLEEMIVNTVKRRDEFAIKEYFEELRCKIYELTDNHKSIEERNNIFYFFRNLFVKAAQTAIKEKEKTILLTILNSIFPIYMHCLNRDIIGESIKELDITLAEILILTVGPDDLLPIRFPIYLKGIKNNIIRLLKKQKNYVENYPEKRLMNILHKLINRAMTVGAEGSVRDILKSFSDILYEVIDTSDMNKLKRIEIVYKTCFYYKNYLLKSVDKGFWDIELLEYSFNSEKLLEAVKTEADFGKQVLMLYCEILLELINRDILDEFSIENIAKIGENIILNEEINTEYSNEAILYIFNIMLKMEKKLETKPDIIIDRHNLLVKKADKLKNLIEENPPKFTRIKNELSMIMPMLTGNKIIGNELINWPDLK